MIDYFERVTRTKLSWFISEADLLSDKEHIAVSVLGSIFYWQSQLDKPTAQEQHMVKRENYKLSLEDLEAETKANATAYAQVMQSLKSKISPMIQRKIHFNLQDLCLLLKPEEAKQLESPASVLEMLSQLPSAGAQQVLVRWVNHILRSYERQKQVYDAKIKAKAKFQKSKEEEVVKRSSSVTKSEVKGKSHPLTERKPQLL